MGSVNRLSEGFVGTQATAHDAALSPAGLSDGRVMLRAGRDFCF